MAHSRDQILYYLKTKGPQTAAQLAERLGITAMAVRQHLAILAGDQLVAGTDVRQKVGRPRRVWRVTDEAASHFPDSHAELCLGMLDAARAAFGEEGLERLLAARGDQQQAAYRALLPGPEVPLRERLEALAAVRTREGYMAEVVDEDGVLVLAENHCPVCAAARGCAGLCRNELALFRAVLGPGVQVERSEHIIEGARRCAYRVEERG